MPLLGAHESIAGGLHHALDDIGRVNGEALQIFTRNQRQWNSAPLAEDEICQFQVKWFENPYLPIASHASYLINLGTSKADLVEKSICSFSDELLRCDRLGIKWVVIHPGSHGGVGVEEGLKNVVKNLDASFARAGADGKVMVLLETTAGQGTSLGSDFKELAYIMNYSRFTSRIGVCLDTCHIFAAGYDIRDKKAYDKTFAEFEKTIGIDRLHFFHINDSKKELGSRVDRHEHIGQGLIGLEGFSFLLNDPRFENHAMTLETPKGKDLAEDRENLKTLRALIGDARA